MEIIKVVEKLNGADFVLHKFFEEIKSSVYDEKRYPKTYDQLSWAPICSLKLNEVLFNNINSEDIILCTNSPLLKGMSNYCKYSICGADAGDDVKKFAEYVSHFPINTPEFDMEAAYAIFYMFADAVGGHYKLAIKKHLLDTLNLKIGTHLLDGSKITESFLESASMSDMFEAIKEL